MLVLVPRQGGSTITHIRQLRVCLRARAFMFCRTHRNDPDHIAGVRNMLPTTTDFDHTPNHGPPGVLAWQMSLQLRIAALRSGGPLLRLLTDPFVRQHHRAVL